MKKVLSIAGSDCSGGAGIQADIKTITVHKMYAMSAITALTAQNTTGVFSVMDATPQFVEQQLDCIFTDIFPNAIKIGMVSNIDIINVIAKKLREYRPRNVVIDPVMISTSGSKLLQEEAIEALVQNLLPLADVITPNLPEAETLCGYLIKDKDGMQKAAVDINKHIHTNVLIKGGHLIDTSDDLLFLATNMHWYEGKRINNPNTHGTGCTLSSAIACNLAAGKSLEESVRSAKEYVTGALKDELDIGRGSGPLNHCYNMIPQVRSNP